MCDVGRCNGRRFNMGFDQEGITPYVEKISPSDGSRTQSIRVCVHAHLHQDTDHHRLGKALDTRQNFSQNDHFDNCTSQIKYSQINSALLQTLATTTSTSTTTPPYRTKSSYEIELRNLSYRRTTTSSPSKKISTYFGVTKNSSEDSPASSSSSSMSKYILKRVNMRARPGEVLGVAGPSGAGKSTLLEILAGRLQPSKCSTIMVNSQPMDVARLRRISGYVMQEDALFPLLTVQETLMYSARLRLPASVPLAEKTRRVEAIMQELGLTHVASSRVGDVGSVRRRGVSGGERRRVSIGVDVIHDPAILILDEPTSGLDSASALHVVEMLSRMAVLRRRTIVLSIHQPSYRILELLPSVLLLAGGRVVHHGAVQILATRLAGAPQHYNILESFLPDMSLYILLTFLMRSVICQP
jgi:ABC-type multidrug transport system ATPase subunit